MEIVLGPVDRTAIGDGIEQIFHAVAVDVAIIVQSGREWDAFQRFRPIVRVA